MAAVRARQWLAAMGQRLTPLQRERLARLLEAEIWSAAREAGADRLALRRRLADLRAAAAQSPPVGEDGEHGGDDPVDDRLVDQ